MKKTYDSSYRECGLKQSESFKLNGERRSNGAIKAVY